MHVEYDFLPTPFGECLAARSPAGICYLAFSDRGRAGLVAEFAAAEPRARRRRNAEWLRELGSELFDAAATDVPLDMRGTEFQRRVWCALAGIPFGATLSYGELAARIGRPEAVRAVAGAVAANRIAWLIPCHRIVRSDGGLGGYRWGAWRKAAMLEHERAVTARTAITQAAA